MSLVIRIATVGTSIITEHFIDAVAGADGRVRVAAVTSRDLARAQAFAERVGVATASDDLEGLIRGGAVDAVYIGTPNGLHASQSAAAIAAGAHVFVEKPATPTAAEWEALVESARAAGVVVFEGMRNVYDPGMAAIREMLPALGVLRRASFTYCQRSARYDLVLAGQTPAIFDPALAGGARADLGVYPLSAMIAFFGAPAQITALDVRIATGVDGMGIALLSYPGMIGEITYSKITRSDRPSEIQGEGGTLEIDHIAQPRHLRLTLLDGTVTERVVDAAANNMRYEVERFADLVEGADAAADQNRTRDVLRALEQIAAGSAML